MPRRRCRPCRDSPGRTACSREPTPGRPRGRARRRARDTGGAGAGERAWGTFRGWTGGRTVRRRDGLISGAPAQPLLARSRRRRALPGVRCSVLLPLAVQLVGRPDGEAILVALAQALG